MTEQRSDPAPSPWSTTRGRDVLVRAPWIDEPARGRPGIIDALDQLEELANLLRCGLVSRAEFDRQKRTLLSS